MSAIKNGIVATGAEDKTVKTWDVQKGACAKTLTGHSGVSILIILFVCFLCWFDLHLGPAHIYLTNYPATTLLIRITLGRSDNKPSNDLLGIYDLILYFYFIFVSATLSCLCQPCVFSTAYAAC